MRSSFSAIALGFSLTCASLPLCAQSASIIANGVGNEGFIEQVNSSGANANIMQTGDNNKAGSAGMPAIPGILQSDSVNVSATIQQNGDKNAATVTQTNTTGSTAAVTQTSAAGVAEGNTANIAQTGNSDGPVQAATVEQKGSNTADVKQSTWGESAAVHQEGGLAGKNIATITQTSFGQQAMVDQAGDNLQASILQTNTDGVISQITQTGANHTANVKHGGFVGNVSVKQSGGLMIGNTAAIEVDGFYGLRTTVNQAGDFLRTEVRQIDGHDKRTTVNQTGYDQYARVQQLGYMILGVGEVLVNQTGQANDAFVTQNSATDSRVDATQFGTGPERNALTISQTGDALSHTYDIAIAKQNGAGNVGTIMQTGNWNLAELEQTGNGNKATITQAGTGSSLATQNHAWITQNGNLHTALITQNGMGNWSGILQH